MPQALLADGEATRAMLTDTSSRITPLFTRQVASPLIQSVAEIDMAPEVMGQRLAGQVFSDLNADFDRLVGSSDEWMRLLPKIERR